MASQKNHAGVFNKDGMPIVYQQDKNYPKKLRLELYELLIMQARCIKAN